MNKFQQLRAKAIAFRGAIAIAICGAVVVAVSMFQAADTLAAPNEMRQAKAEIATQNYFPTPLASSISCSNSGTWGFRSANVRWSPPAPIPDTPPIVYQYRVDRVNNGGTVVNSFVTTNTTTRINVGTTNQSFRIRVHTISPGNTSAVSSGYRSHAIHSSTIADTYCSGSPYPITDAPNQSWENQYDWDTDVNPLAAGPSPSMFGALFGEDADLLGELPEGGELNSLDESTVDATPATPEKTASSPSSTWASQDTSSSPAQSSPSSTAASSSGATSARESAADSSTSAPATPSSPTAPTASATATPSSVQSMPSPPTPTATAAVAQASVRARVGDGQIVVRESQARLEAVDGRTQLIVTRKGSEVCTAEVDGASWIDSYDGGLAVTVSGRTVPVDLETCDLA